MSGTITADRRHISEAAVRPERLAFKNADGEDSIAGGLIALDEAEGIVTAVVSVTGVEDEVADIIEPGAYAATLAKRNPKVCWAHSWEQPIGKVLYIEELMPGDRRLPRRTRDGKAWPREAGALVATMQFNLKSDRGREAFSAVEFFSRTGECEYSIGYQVPPGKSTKSNSGVRHIKSLELYELSVVLFGAHTMTGTLSLKEAAEMAAMERKAGRGSGVLNGEYTGTVGIERKAAGSSSDGYAPPQGAVDAAQRGLDLRREHGRGGTSVGIARARDIAGGKKLPLATVKRMASFFARHQGDKSGDGWGDTSKPSNGYIAWLLWGGDAGKTWADSIVKREEAKDAGEATLDGLDHLDDGLDHSVLALSEAKAGRRKAADFKPCARCGSTKVSHLTGPDQPRCAECGFHVALKAEAKAVAEGVDGDFDDADGAPDFSDGVMVALYPDGEAADAVYAQIAGPDDTLDRDELHVTLAYLGTIHEVTLDADEIAERVEGAIEGMPVLTGEIGGIGMFPDSGDGAPTWAPVDVPGLGLMREAIAEALGESVRTDHGFTPHMTLGYDLGLIDPIAATPVTFSSVRVVFGNQQHDIALGNGALSNHRDGPGRKSAYDPALDLKAEGGADQNRGGAEKLRHYWVHGEGAAKIRWGQPGDFNRCVRLVSKHMDPERAKGYCNLRHQDALGVPPGQEKSMPVFDYDPILDLDSLVAGQEAKDALPTPAPVGIKAFPYLTGTYEERIAALRTAVAEALRGEQLSEDTWEWPYVDLRATWDDQLIATRANWSVPGDTTEDWRMSYTLTDDGVELGEPERVHVTLLALPDASDMSGEDDDELTELDQPGPDLDDYPLPEDLARIIATIKSCTLRRPETKAGRVLSGRNERRLRSAVEELLSVLRAAGVNFDDGDEPMGSYQIEDTAGDTRREVDPNIDVESTAPDANLTSRKALLDVTRVGDGVAIERADVDALLRSLVDE